MYISKPDRGKWSKLFVVGLLVFSELISLPGHWSAQTSDMQRGGAPERHRMKYTARHNWSAHRLTLLCYWLE